MALHLVGVDPESGGGNCPTVWVDQDTRDLVIQGWKADEHTTRDCLQTGTIPATEAVVRIPARMVPMMREACDAAKRPQL
ncbi:hypothetical protein J7W19_19775 [Streptomyces mobaraensis NBRC 13819 = DSM 40847]|uniref:Uncharacterized protein n=2 Tax=Streptomyces mobaraensis TaxID=35621 RepID=A0A5N5WI20_STRMB|nr:hypothetical protein [Streptomyces mobaraensis]EME99665.1 hypothetical protein H340_15366 [Streptomyces mobaraensis NBRC 13819 = DSM 40847]KAB7852809.1 hypothetical protein FRZ00_00975 [Streptomyces mobaraensis]QTT75314.1 hypothetical protein J7W19_19775 [Streptomyces mobaraensis NBRC 13819 = DSM 40847]